MKVQILLTEVEANRLANLESTITRGQKTFIEVGCALAEIRDRKLYRTEHKTFEAYCQERWGWSKSYSNMLVAASEVVKSLPPKTATIVVTESQAREILKVAPERRVEVLQVVAANGPVTAKKIKEAASVVSQPEPSPEPERESPVSSLAADVKRWQIVLEELKQTFLSLPADFKREFREWAAKQ